MGKNGIPSYDDLLDLYFAFSAVHGVLAVYLDLKLSDTQPAFREGGEVELLHKLAQALEEVETVKERHGLGFGRMRGGAS